MILTFFFILLFTSFSAYAYIDPATGSAFFSVFMGIISFFICGFYFLVDRFFLVPALFRKKIQSVDIILYSEGKKYWRLFQPILAELDKRGIKAVFYTSSLDDGCFNQTYQHIKCQYIGEGNKAYAKLAFVRAKIVVMTTPGLNVYQLKKSKYVNRYVHIYHALADCCSYRLFGTDYYDTLLIANHENMKYVRDIEAKRHLPAKELVVVGEVWLDQLKEQIDSFPMVQSDKKTVLLAPTWGKESLLTKFENQIIDILLQADYTVIIRPHPQMKTDNPALLSVLENRYKDNLNVIWDYRVSAVESMVQSSVLVSDFSGIIFEYAFLLHKPVFIVNKNLNLEQYDASDLSYLTWRYTAWEKIGQCLADDEINSLPNMIEQVINQQHITQQIIETSNLYWEEQGCATHNIVNYLENKLKDITAC